MERERNNRHIFVSVLQGNLFIIYLHFIYRWQYIKTHDLKVQLNCIAVQIIRYMHAN